MSSAAPERRTVEAWLRELGSRPRKALHRDGVVSWDLRLDGRRQRAIPITVILAPGIGCLVWVPFAPPLRDEFRKSYRRLLRWNEDYPFVKFGVTDDERPVMSAEIPEADLDLDRLGEALARCVALCDLLHDETERWRRGGPPIERGATSAAPLLERYRERLGELATPS